MKRIKKDYCISFLPLKNNTPDILNIQQIFLKLTDSKAADLKEMFDANNKVSSNILLNIEEFKLEFDYEKERKEK